MSIIEKAAERLDREKEQAAPVITVERPPQAAAVRRETEPAAAAADIPHASTASHNPHIPHRVPSVPEGALDAFAALSPSAASATSATSAKAGTSAASATGATAAAPVPVEEPSPRQAAPRFQIDLERLQRMGVITPDGARSSLAEEFRIIKRPLLEKAFINGAPRQRSNLIMVTSSMPGEGKTFCAVNLAMSIAKERDHTVLLVDADVARPAVPKMLGLDTDKGLLDLLHDDKLDVRDVIYGTNIERLRIMPSGKSHKLSTELLASQAMGKLLDEIANRYADRIVIFDSPPMLITSEARALAREMGQIVLVVEAQSTTQRGVKETLRQLGRTDNVNLVYNKARYFLGQSYYAGYY